MTSRRLILPLLAGLICLDANQCFAGAPKGGQGTITVSPTVVNAGSSNNFKFSFRGPGSGTYSPGSQATWVVPAGWNAPQTNNASARGFVRVIPTAQAAAAVSSISGTGPWTVTVDFSTTQKLNGFDLLYTNTIAPTNGGIYTFDFKTRQSGGTLRSFNSGSPTVTVNDTNKIGTSIAVDSSANPAVYGQVITFTATVSSVATGVLSGTITFRDGDVVLASLPVNAARQASFSTNGFSVTDSPHTVVADYSGDTNFNGSVSAILSQVITEAPLTVSGVVGQDKTYDGSTAASIDLSGAALVGVIAGDTVTLDISGATASFADSNVGTNKPVAIGGLALAGADAMNYTLTQPSATANITSAASIIPPQPVTINLSLNPDHSVQLNCSGAPNQTFVIQATTELTGSWSTISTNVLDGDGLGSFNDGDAGQLPSRFYRTMISF